MTDKEILDRIKRVEEISNRAYKLARLVRRRYNKNTKIFSANFEVFDEEVKRNTANIDKIVHTLQELIGDGSIEILKEKEEDEYTKSLYL